MTRKEVIQCIEDGKVTAHQSPILDPRRLIFDDNKVFVEGHPLPPSPERVVYAFNKPSGLISAYKSELGKPNIGFHMDQMGKDLIHIGRLDKLTTGLLLITNDGDLCHALTHPSCKIEKKYLLQIEGSTAAIGDQIEKLSHPIVNRKMKVEVTYQAKKVQIISSSSDETFVEVTLTEGKNRQIRRMCAILHLELRHLHRAKVGTVDLGDLPLGGFRPLRSDEMKDLYAPFGGIDGFERKRANQLLAQLDSGAFLPDLANDVKTWKESYLG